ncbi:NAD-dependent epimerase/dehydratase family protein [bacterium]|nr:MAG: NAD-dependent epimerase/dehydratase family protein [bacterium]
MQPQATSALELWGGVECTYNRVHETYFSQLKWNGHLQRLDDLDRFADLGVQALRYPVIWEMLAPSRPDEIDWTFPDERLNRLRELNIRPIAGLVHHGSGPRYAPIDSPLFASGLADYARSVAERFPWIEAYTPVNEPLTTARFCGLYGHWYPHGSSSAAFVRILLNECRATIEAMQAIREVNPAAQLIQTEDLGRIYSTPKMEYQTQFENERRWLSFDLLCGRVNKEHALWDYLLESQAEERELHWFLENPCPPDVLGINHYPTSDRFLDEQVASHPEEARASNGRDHYADVAAVRVLPTPPGGFKERLCEAWNRYEIPVAITEAHLGCSREEQVRWLNQAWNEAKELREAGVPVRAVTPWSFLGAWNWNSLVTRDANYYEPGVFDTRSPTPRPTALAKTIKALSREIELFHPVLTQPGWWRRPQRLLGSQPRSWALEPGFVENDFERELRKTSFPLVIIGRNTVLGQAFAHACDVRGLPYFLLSSADLNIRDIMSVEMILGGIHPWAVINAAEYGDIAGAEVDADTCFSFNTQGAVHLAEVCARRGFRLVCFSTDHVFDGRKTTPYLEMDVTTPLGIYGQSKALMEQKVLATYPSTLIARTGPLFSRQGKLDLERAASEQSHWEGPNDASHATVVSPTFAPDLADATLDLLIDGEFGLWNLVNDGHASWTDLVRMSNRGVGIDGDTESAAPAAALVSNVLSTSRVLASERGQILPDLEDAVRRWESSRA